MNDIKRIVTRADALLALEKASWDDDNILSGAEIWGVHGNFAAGRTTKYFTYESAKKAIAECFGAEKRCIGLNEKGRRELAVFLINHASDATLKNLFGPWEDDVNLDQNIGHIEMAAHYTQSKNPVDHIISGDGLEFELID